MIISKIFRGGVLCVTLLGRATPAFAQASIFSSNELRAVSVRDRLQNVTTTLRDGSAGARRHSEAVSAAFKGTRDWAPAAETYYARKGDLVARANALEAKLDAAIARNSSEHTEDVTKALDSLSKFVDVLRSDFEFYMKLPTLADGPQRRAAQSAMRLLGQTGDYPVSLAYFLDKTPNRAPYEPLPPGVMSIRHK
jgi:hypothetical protein